MSYVFEQLNDESFQQLCQALITHSFPTAQCLPVGQPDGGRDAFIRGSSKAGQHTDLVVFQVKFSKTPHLKNERDVVEELIRTESSKISKLIDRGAQSYYLLTNVSGTSHLGVGSVDQVNKTLSDLFQIPCFCWWRDDLSRRIDANSSIKWSFPNILRTEDLLQVLIEGRGLKDASRISQVLKSYLAYQYDREAKLKFKQIDLHKELSEQFVDVPALIAVPDSEHERQSWGRRFDVNFAKALLEKDNERRTIGGEYSEQFLQRAHGALNVLGQTDVSKAFPRIVLEGAPGQGKSTVTQYLAQIYRMRLLSKDRAFASTSESHRNCSALPDSRGSV